MPSGTPFFLPKQVPFIGGAIAPSSYVYFYQTGTTTEQTVYQDSALSSAHTQPITADSNGFLAPIYLNPDAAVDYRFRLYDSSDNLIYTEDAVPRIDENFENQTVGMTWAGFSADPSNTDAEVYRMGRLVIIELPVGTGTSNSTGFSIGTIPTDLRPSTTQYFTLPYATDNGSLVVGGCVAQINTDGSIVFSLAGAAFGTATWTASSTKGITTTGTILYRLDDS